MHGGAAGVATPLGEGRWTGLDPANGGKRSVTFVVSAVFISLL